MFSFKIKSNQPVAKVEGGINHGKVLYIHQDSDRSLRRSDNPDYFFYCDLQDGQFMYLPDQRPNQTSRLIVASNAGAGKSVNICKYIKEFHQVFPNSENTILLTSHNSEDDEVDPFRSVRDLLDTIEFTEDMIESPIELSDLYNHDEDTNRYLPQLVVFDDYEDLPNKLEKEIYRLRKAICTKGRQFALHLVCINQTLSSTRSDFRSFINGTTGLVYFPAREPINLKYLLKAHYDISNDLYIDLHRNTTSRWVLINKDDTPYILTETSAMIYDPVRESERLKELKKIGKL